MEGGEVAGIGLVPYPIVCQSKGYLLCVLHVPDESNGWVSMGYHIIELSRTVPMEMRRP